MDRIYVEMEEDPASAMGKMTQKQAIATIQRNERGRQGKARALLMKELREEEKQRRMYDMSAASATDKDPQFAASTIQKVTPHHHHQHQVRALALAHHCPHADYRCTVASKAARMLRWHATRSWCSLA